MPKKKKFVRKNLPNNSDEFVSPLLREEGVGVNNLKKIDFNFPSIPSSLQKHNELFTTSAGIEQQEKFLLGRPSVWVRPITDLKENGSSASVIFPSVKSDLPVKVESDAIKTEPINYDESTSENSSSNSSIVIYNEKDLEQSIVMLSDSDSENVDCVQLADDEIVLPEADICRMELNQKLDESLQSEQITKKNLNHQIFVGNLPKSITKSHLVKFFETFGRITDVKFIRSITNKMVICFLTYENQNCAYDALSSNGLLYNKRNFRVSLIGRNLGNEDCTIYVSNLPYRTSTQDLYNLFESCGQIRSLYFDMEFRKSTAYITYELKESADYAVCFNNFMLRNSLIHCEKYNKQIHPPGVSLYIS